MILVSKKVKDLSDIIATRSMNEANYYPIDRYFLNQFIEQILSLNIEEFVFYNLEKVNPTYVNLLFLCLPEIWEQISVNEIEDIIENFTNDFSYFTIIEFTYKYIEVDIIPLILKSIKSEKIYQAVIGYLSNQWNNIVMSDEEKMDLENSVGQEFFHYNNLQWVYIKQKFLLDDRIRPALRNSLEVKEYIENLVKDKK